MVDLQQTENIIFDLGGVLLNIDYDLTAQAFKDLGFHTFDDYYSQRKQTALFDDFETGRITSEEFVADLAQQAPQAHKNNLVEAWNAMLLDLPKHRVELLTNLKKDFRIFLLSNTNQVHEDAFVKIVEDAYGTNVLNDAFEVVHLSHKIGFRKPNQDCFDYVLDSAGLKAENTVFIDDSIQHVKGADQAKIKAYHLEKGRDVISLFPDRFQPIHRS